MIKRGEDKRNEINIEQNLNKQAKINPDIFCLTDIFIFETVIVCWSQTALKEKKQPLQQIR